MKLRFNGIAKLLVLLLLVTLVVAGCAKAPLTLEQTRKGTVSYHVWGALISYGIEQKTYPGYAVYTYVLFNSNQPDAGSPEEKRYDSILKAILQDVKTQQVGKSAGWPINETNIFCIPFVTWNPKKANALEKYDFDLSLKYLAILQGAVKNNKELFKRLEQRPGPFLISFYEPLPKLQGKAATKMLYLDLTDMPPDGMRQILDAYKQRLDSEPLKNVEKLKESLKIIMMKYALLIDENLKIVDIAYARFK